MRAHSEKHQEDLKHAAGGGFVNLLNAAGAIAVPALHGLIVWAYGPLIYGLYSVGISIAEAASKVGTLGLDKGVLRQIPQDRISSEPSAVYSTLWTSLLLSLGIGALIAFGLYALAGVLAPLFGSQEYVEAISYLAISVPLFAVTNVLVSATLAAKVVRYNLLVKGVLQPFLLILFAAVFSMRPSLEFLSFANFLALAVALLAAGWGTWKVFGLSSKKSDARSQAKLAIRWELLRFSLPLGLAEFLNLLTQRASLIILAFFVPADQVAAYAACDMLVRAIGGVRNAFDPVLSPILSEALKLQDHQRVSYNLKLVTRWVIALMLPVAFCFIIFSDDLLTLLDPNFKTASLVLSLLSIAYSVNGALGLNGWVLVMDGRSWLTFTNNAISSAVNIALAIWLIPHYGILGSGIATSVSIILAQILIFGEVAYLKRLQPLSLGIFRLMLASGLCLAAFIFLFPSLPQTGVTRIIIGVLLFLIIYLIAWRLVALSQEDAEVLAHMRKKVAKLVRRRS